MTVAEAKTFIGTMADTSAYPELSDAELDQFVGLARRPDADGLTVADEEWTPTWDLAYAIHRALELRATKAANAYDFTTGSQTMNRSQLMANLLKAAERWKARVNGSFIVDLTKPTPAGRVDENNTAKPWIFNL
jgi:hypothetical protein